MPGKLLAFTLALLCISGCTISRRIRDVEPPRQPPLQELEQHLDYTDPDAGEPDYIVGGGIGAQGFRPA